MSGEHLATEIAKSDFESLLFQDNTVTSSVISVRFHEAGPGRRTAAALSESLGLSSRLPRPASVHSHGAPESEPWPTGIISVARARSGPAIQPQPD